MDLNSDQFGPYIGKHRGAAKGGPINPAGRHVKGGQRDWASGQVWPAPSNLADSGMHAAPPAYSETHEAQAMMSGGYVGKHEKAD